MGVARCARAPFRGIVVFARLHCATKAAGVCPGHKPPVFLGGARKIIRTRTIKKSPGFCLQNPKTRTSLWLALNRRAGCAKPGVLLHKTPVFALKAPKMFLRLRAKINSLSWRSATPRSRSSFFVITFFRETSIDKKAGIHLSSAWASDPQLGLGVRSRAAT